MNRNVKMVFETSAVWWRGKADLTGRLPSAYRWLITEEGESRLQCWRGWVAAICEALCRTNCETTQTEASCVLDYATG